MVQAAAQAQAVVAAAKNRGGGLVPMNAAQISALSQIQAQAIVNARPQTAITGSGTTTKRNEKPTPQQIQNQTQLQAQALVHAHTQAQISAGIYKGGEPAPAAATKPTPQAPLSLPASAPARKMREQALLPSAANQINPHHRMAPQPLAIAPQPASASATSLRATAHVPLMAPIAGPPKQTQYISSGAMIVPSTANVGIGDDIHGGGVVMPATSPEFLSKMNESLTQFWSGQLQEMKVLGMDKVQTEQDFKNHNDLPLARIKRIMKSDEDVRMISAEAPVLFAKACEMFILEMTLRSWNYSENNKRKTLQKEDVKESISRTDILDFLVDVIH